MALGAGHCWFVSSLFLVFWLSITCSQRSVLLDLCSSIRHNSYESKRHVPLGAGSASSGIKTMMIAVLYSPGRAGLFVLLAFRRNERAQRSAIGTPSSAFRAKATGVSDERALNAGRTGLEPVVGSAVISGLRAASQPPTDQKKL